MEGTTTTTARVAFTEFLESEASKRVNSLFTPAEVIETALTKSSSPSALASTTTGSSHSHKCVALAGAKIASEVRSTRRRNSCTAINSSARAAPVPFMLNRDSKVVAQSAGFLMDTDLRALMKHTGYSRRELFDLFCRFKALAALSVTVGGIDRETFKRGMLSIALEDAHFADRVFSLLDADGSGTIEFAEFLTSEYLIAKGSREARAEFLFRAYDTDCSNSLERDELYDLFKESLRIQGEPDDTTADVLRSFANEIFEEVEGKTKKKGESLHISKEDVYVYVHSHPQVDVGSAFGRSMLVGADADVYSILRKTHKQARAGASTTTGTRRTRRGSGNSPLDSDSSAAAPVGAQAEGLTSVQSSTRAATHSSSGISRSSHPSVDMPPLPKDLIPKRLMSWRIASRDKKVAENRQIL